MIYEYDIGTHWVAIYVKNDVATYFDSFGVEHILKVIPKFIGNKITKAKVYKIQDCDSITCGYFCHGFINFMLNNNRPADFANLFSPNN